MLNLVYYFSSVERGFSSRLTENNRMTVGCRWRRWCRRCKQAGCRKRGETKEVDESRCQETTDGIWFALFGVDWYIRRYSYALNCIVPHQTDLYLMNCGPARRLTNHYGDKPLRWQILYGFYRAMLCIRGTSHGPVSVRPSVCLSICPSVRHKSEFY